jgi:hypothetical protein
MFWAFSVRRTDEHLQDWFCRSFRCFGVRGRFSVRLLGSLPIGPVSIGIRTDALLATLLIGTLVAIELFGKSLGKPK